MVRAEFNKKRHIIALIFTIIIFSSGLIFGYLAANLSYSSIEKINEQQKVEYESLQLQYNYMSDLLETKNCPAALQTLEKNINILEKARFRLEKYTKKDNSLTTLKREYILSEIRYWFLVKKTKEICEQDTVSILYFYSPEDCIDCETQGEILTYLKDKLKEKVLIFSIDSTFVEEPMVSILKKAYGVESTPSLIIENEKHEGLIKQEEVLKEICMHYKVKSNYCN
jgi:hypothetical protein